MKAAVILLAVFCYVECRKIVPIDKNANLAFINMEGGGGTRPNAVKPAAPANVKPVVPTPLPTKPTPPPILPMKPSQPGQQQPTPGPVSAKPSAPVPVPAKPSSPAVQPTQPTQITPKPVHPPVVSNPITTPGPGSVKQLINFYDSQGKASPIRPYSYSQAVKQG